MSPPFPKRKLLMASVLFLFLFLIHLTYLPNGFTWLDHGDIEQKASVRSPLSIAAIMTEPFARTGFYRPLVTFTNSMDFVIYRDFAPGYHVTNVFLHLLVVAVTPLFLSVFITLTFPEALLIMLIVGVHPLGWLPVGAISYRPELLVTIFTFLTVYLHAKARKTGNSLFATGAVLCFFAALLSKETALFLVPAFIVLWEITKQKKLQMQAWTLLFLPESAVIGIYLLLHITAVPQIWHVAPFTASLSEALGTRFFVISKLLFDLVSPLKPNLSDAVPITPIFSPATFLVCFFGICAGWIIFRTGWKSTWSKAILLLGITLMPALSIVPVPRVGSAHYGYIPLTVFSLIIILFLRLTKRRSWYFFVCTLIVTGLWIVIQVYGTWYNGKQFHNDWTLFAPEVEKDSHFLEGYFYLGNYYALDHQYSEATKAYSKALHPDVRFIAYSEHTSTVINLAQVELKQHHTAAAIQLFESLLPLPDPKQDAKLRLFITQLKQSRQ